MSALLDREGFRTQVFARDGGLCVFCGAPAADAHHLIERKLFSEPDETGGYLLSNGISVCENCHLLCEATKLSPQEGRVAAGITEVVVPHILDEEPNPELISKWGDPVDVEGNRRPGPLFFEPEVQKILREAGMLSLYIFRFRYPRTPHVPFSPGNTSDDRVLADLSAFAGKEIVVTEKRDGGNATLYADGYFHARSLSSVSHRHETRVRAALAAVAPQLPAGWRICGENLQARHSIEYKHLASYFEVFSIWNERNECLSWEETEEWCALLGLTTVPVLYRGPFDEATLHTLWTPNRHSGDPMEGWVMRTAEGFPYRRFAQCVAKFVRVGHVQTDQHWSLGPMVENELERGEG